MKNLYVLGIDTATLVCSVALVTEDKLLAEYTLQVKKTHSERLLPLIAAVLEDAGVKPKELDGIAVAAGPGSFTGLRIGVVTAKALGQALELPLCGISTLEALAAQHPLFNGLVCPVLDARRGQVYNAVFLAGREVLRETDDRAITLSDLLAELSGRKEHVLFVGDAVKIHRQMLIEALGERACFVPEESTICRAATVARLGLLKLKAAKGQSWQDLVPHYIRRAGAESKFQAVKDLGRNE
ncbi:MAG: tRNA (adenosine(37)-N6)-threonylcarbamoyltransferase complex dimerization subunit type 1 TsaB [Firmicutes bacterium]|nr:tRNA (adenosine(37)-N6)-threonylcarbamoyltransferase complex dimerization subunit type 1 TsaB [Bacillota bacterium]